MERQEVQDESVIGFRVWMARVLQQLRTSRRADQTRRTDTSTKKCKELRTSSDFDPIIASNCSRNERSRVRTRRCKMMVKDGKASVPRCDAELGTRRGIYRKGKQRNENLRSK